jgi:cell division protein FtsQ
MMRKQNRINASLQGDQRWGRVVQMCFIASMGIGFIMAMSATFLLAYDVLTQWDYFNVTQIDIRGANRLSKTELCDQTKIKEGANIFSANLSKAQKRLLAHPWIAEAKIGRRPPKGIQMVIREHAPLAFIKLNRTYVINTQGEIFKEKSPNDRFRLPVIQGIEFADIPVKGKPKSPPFQAVMEVLDLGKRRGNVLPNRKINRILVDREIGLTLYAFKKEMAIWLGYHNYPEKYERLKHVLSYLRRRKNYEGIYFIDLNNEKRIVVQPIKVKVTGEGKNKEVSFAETRKYYRWA